MTRQSSFLVQNSWTLLGGSLLFLVLSSKNILIYNEELLIALSFLGFVLFSTHTMSASVTEAFEARRTTIQQELQAYYQLKEALLLELLEAQQKRKNLGESLRLLGQLSVNDIAFFQEQREQALLTIFTSQMHQKLKLLVHHEKSGQEALSHTLVLSFRDAVLEKFQRERKTLGPQLIEQALQTLA